MNSKISALSGACVAFVVCNIARYCPDGYPVAGGFGFAVVAAVAVVKIVSLLRHSMPLGFRLPLVA